MTLTAAELIHRCEKAAATGQTSGNYWDVLTARTLEQIAAEREQAAAEHYAYVWRHSDAFRRVELVWAEAMVPVKTAWNQILEAFKPVTEVVNKSLAAFQSDFVLVPPVPPVYHRGLVIPPLNSRPRPLGVPGHDGGHVAIVEVNRDEGNMHHRVRYYGEVTPDGVDDEGRHQFNFEVKPWEQPRPIRMGIGSQCGEDERGGWTCHPAKCTDPEACPLDGEDYDDDGTDTMP